MNTLEEARAWHLATGRQLRLLRRLGERYWDELPWTGDLGNDPRLGQVEQSVVVRETQASLSPLADLAIVVMFSVFEATVRDAVLKAVNDEIPGLAHPTLVHAAKEALRAVEEGSFYRVLEPFKTEGRADLVEEVNQVRKYRNWVAHGRRGKRPDRVEPEAAYQRLRRFLDIIQPPAAEPP
jgi:hypothetical protein